MSSIAKLNPHLATSAVGRFFNNGTLRYSDTANGPSELNLIQESLGSLSVEDERAVFDASHRFGIYADLILVPRYHLGEIESVIGYRLPAEVTDTQFEVVRSEL